MIFHGYIPRGGVIGLNLEAMRFTVQVFPVRNYGCGFCIFLPCDANNFRYKKIAKNDMPFRKIDDLVNFIVI
jgi:hypothetical protein